MSSVKRPRWWSPSSCPRWSNGTGYCWSAHEPLLLDYKRVKVEVGDVTVTLREGKGRFDVILLDVDNGLPGFSQASNAGLYDNAGLIIVREALKPEGMVAVWSAWDDRKFEHRLRHHGFTAETHHVRARLKQGGRRHTIFVGRT